MENVEFTRRDSAKRILIKSFTQHIDYKIVAPQKSGAPKEKDLGGVKAAYQFGKAAFSSKIRTKNSLLNLEERVVMKKIRAKKLLLILEEQVLEKKTSINIIQFR